MIKIINANSGKIKANDSTDKTIINQEDYKIPSNKQKMIRLENNRIIVNKNIVFLIGIFLILAASVVAQQTLPTLISLQGKLTNTSTGTTIVTADLRVNISDTSGATVWNETFLGGVSNGFFDLLLGSNIDNPLSLTFNQDYNISIYVGTSGTQIGGSYRFRSGVGGINPSNITAGNFSALGNFSFGGSLFVDKTNNRVGIGTTAPSSSLDVNGNVDLGATSGTLFVDSANARVGIGTTGPSDVLDVIGSARFSRSLNASEINATKLRINNNLFANGSRVGIGTSAPGTILEVSGNISTTPSNTSVVKSSGFISNIGGLLSNFGSADGGFYFINNENGAMSLVTAGADRIRIDQNGNTGIGTNAPTKKLSVNGTTNALTVDPSAKDPTINTTGQNITISSSSGSVIIQLG
ncbi:hypothetical protein HYU09_02550 [Candidatus Woesearchaeota archaeon]|nr:hypothetical protein [Candidatus Woesearchaeota archaeon]